MKSFKSQFAALLLMFLLMPGAWAQDQLVVSDAAVREAPPGMRVTAAYAVLTNAGEADIVIDAVSSEAFNLVEIHLTRVTDGVASMQQQSSLTIPANGSVILEPGGFHFMLMGAKSALKAGDKIDVTLHASGGNITAEFVVKKIQ